MSIRTKYFQQFLRFFWLRPESALLLAIRTEKYASTTELMGEYDDIFEKLNLNVVSKSPIYGGTIMNIWDIGLRPLFRPLSKMVSSLTPDNRSDIKREWCNLLYNFFYEYIDGYSCEKD